MNEEVLNYSQPIKFIIGIAGCVDNTTEYLSKDGWNKIEDYNGEDIAIVNEDNNFYTIDYEKPLDYISEVGEYAVYNIQDPSRRSSINMCLTPNHRVPYLTLKKHSHIEPLQNIIDDMYNRPFSRGKQIAKSNIPTGFNYLGNREVNLSDGEISLMLAIQADGNLQGELEVRFNFKRMDKIANLITILDGLDIKYNYNPNGADGYHQFYIGNRQYQHLWLKDISILWDVSPRQARLVSREVIKWDGGVDTRTGQPRYYTTHKGNADVIQYILAIATNKQVTISSQDRRDKEHGSKYCIEYSVNVTTKSTASFNSLYVSKEVTDRIYCFTTSSTLWLARRGDFVFVTGNTGKSTRLAKEANNRSVVLTPTHKAKEVLLAKGVKNVATIHSVLKLVPTLDQNFRKRGNLQRLQRIGDVDLKSIDNIIIDEYSMVSTSILDILLDLLPAHTPVTIFGDSMQLSPTDGYAIDPEFYQTKGIEELTTQYRADNPAIVETFTRFADYVRTGDHTIDLRVDLPKGTLKGFDPLNCRALAYTNERVIDINNRIAKQLNLPKEISIGETVVINSLIGTLVEKPQYDILTIYPKCVSKGKLMSGDKLLEGIESVEDDMETYNQSIINGIPYFIEIEGEIYKFYGDINHYAGSKTFKREVEDAQLALIEEYNLAEDVDLKYYCRTHKNSHTKARGKAWSYYLGHKSRTWDLRRPFATTVHSSQGSEYNTVYIDQTDIKKAIRGNYYESYSRLMYVALSRAIKKVVII